MNAGQKVIQAVKNESPSGKVSIEGIDRAEFCKKYGFTKPTVQNVFCVINRSPTLAKKIEKGQISAARAYATCRGKMMEESSHLLKEMIDGAIRIAWGIPEADAGSSAANCPQASQ